MVNVKYRRKNGSTDCGQIYTGYKKNETKKEKTPAVFFYHPYGFEKELYMTIYISIHSARNTKKNAVVAHMIV